MKKILLMIFTAMLTAIAWGANPRFPEPETKGLISDIAFTPLQLTLLPMDNAQLFDGKTHCFFAFGLFLVEQQSTIISFAPFQGSNNNYFLKAGLFNISENNWALAAAPVNFDSKNYGLQVGMYNQTAFQDWGMQAGIYNQRGMIQLGLFNINGRFQLGLRNKGYRTYDESKEKDVTEVQFGVLNSCKKSGVQFGLINGGGTIQSGLCNLNKTDGFQFGLFNASLEIYNKETSFQLGLLNYNSRSYIPWLPLVNWDMGREVENDSSK